MTPTTCTCHPGTTCTSAASCATARELHFGAQPAVRCDGNHGGPRCADPECWNDDPPAQPAAESPCACWPGRMCSRSAQCAREAQPAAVSDEQIRHDANLPFVEDEQGAEWVTLSPAMFARAVRRVLALRPQAVPMTDDEFRKGYASCNLNSAPAALWFEAGVRYAEAHHGITAQAKEVQK